MPASYWPRTASFSARRRVERAYGLDDFGLLGADGIGIEGDRRLHGRHRQQLEHVVGHHVAQRAGLLVELAAALDADGLRRRDLDMVDVLAIPQRLEQAVGEAQRHDVLDRFLAEEMVDPIDLMLLQRLQDLGIERLGRRQIVAERLLDHDPAPLAVVFRHQARGAEPGDRHAEEAIGDGEIEEAVARRAGRLVQLRQMLAEPAIGLGIVEVALQIASCGRSASATRSGRYGRPGTRRSLGDEFVHRVGEALRAIPRVLLAAQVDADEPEAVGQPLGVDQIVERRHDQTLGQVAGGAEDHHGAGRRHRGASRSAPCFAGVSSIVV